MNRNAPKGIVVATILLSAGIAFSPVPGIEKSARACGGLFCNSRPPDPFAPLPVAQTGENVVFAIDKDPAGGATTLTAHIQIRYVGDAAAFSWIVPVDANPDTIQVGTDRLFVTLENLTRPTFTTQSLISGTCLPNNPGVVDAGRAGTGGSSASGGAGGSAGSNGSNPGVTVTFQGAVGPFDTAVLTSTDATALKSWLTTNGYVVSDQASGLIDSYVRDKKFFVALKLLNGVGVSSIQPIVLKFKGTEPCVPIRLTAIAANPDMPIRLWVLSEKRAVPKNFLELNVDDARIDWLSGGANYNALVSEAANEAGGNAFVAEYAGTASIAAGTLWTAGQFNLTALQAAQTPPAYVQALTSLGLANDPLTLPLLSKYIPMPMDLKDMKVTPSAFYGNIGTYWSTYAFPPFDLKMLTSEITSKIIEPRHLAQVMIDGHSYLTRLNTFISPEEMNLDPLFIENKDLPTIPANHTAVFRIMCGDQEFMYCNAPVRMELPSGRRVWVRAGSRQATCTNRPYDLSRLKTLPAAERAWQREDVGEGIVMIDNRANIQTAIDQVNADFEMSVPDGGMPDGGTPDTTSADAGGPDGGGVLTGNDAGASLDASTGMDASVQIVDGGGGKADSSTQKTAAAGGGSGCACTLASNAADDRDRKWELGFGFVLACGVLVNRRRRRARG